MSARPRSRRGSEPTAFIGRRLIVDDDVAWAKTFAARLRETRPVDIACRVADAEALLAGPYPYIGFVIDVVLPVGNGYELLRQLRERGIDAPVILVTGADEVTHRLHLRAGALGARLVHKDDEVMAPEAFAAITESFVELSLDHEQQTLGPRAALFDLSGGTMSLAELQVVELRLNGCTNAYVAEQLCISVKTVKNHVSRALAKCGATGIGVDGLNDAVHRRSLERRSRG